MTKNLNLKCSKFPFILLALLLFLLSASTVSGLRVSGVILQATPAPGEHVSLVMEVGIGQNDTPVNIAIDVMDWRQSLQGDNNAVESYTSPYSAKKLLKVTPERLHLEPGDAQKVNVEADIPQEAKSGGRYAIINVHAAPENADISSVSTEVAVNALLALNITGPGIQKSGEITYLKVEAPSSANQYNVSMIFNNTGNIHYKILTEVMLEDKDSNVLANSTIQPFSSVLPGASRLQQFFLTPAEQLHPGAYTIEAKVSLESGRVLASRSTEINVKY